MKKLHVAIGLLLLGIMLLLVSYPNLYSWNTEVLDSSTVPIAANSSNKYDVYVTIGPDLKEVEVIVDNGPWHYNSLWGECVWITKPFQMSLLGGQGNTGSSIGHTTGISPPVDYIFDVPSSWNVLGGVSISNPESEPVSVYVKIIFFKQILNSLWLTALIVGIIATVAGIVLLSLSIKRSRKQPLPMQDTASTKV